MTCNAWIFSSTKVLCLTLSLFLSELAIGKGNISSFEFKNDILYQSFKRLSTLICGLGLELKIAEVAGVLLV